MRGDRAAESSDFLASSDRPRGAFDSHTDRELIGGAEAFRGLGVRGEQRDVFGESLLTAADDAALRRESLLSLARRIHHGLRQRRSALTAARARLEARSAELEQREREVRWAESTRDRKDSEEARRLAGRIAELGAWESSLRLESERLDSLWQRRTEVFEAREEGLAQRESELVQRERQLQQREALVRQQQKQLEEFTASVRLDAEREAFDSAANQERLTREHAVLERNRHELECRSREIGRMVVELDRLLGSKLDWDAAVTVEGASLPPDLPFEREARDRQALAMQGERIARLVEQVETQVIGALEDRLVSERLHRHLCTVCDPQRVVSEETSLRERLGETMRGVVGLLREHRRRVQQWHTVLDEQSERLEQRRRRRWEQLVTRWKVLGFAVSEGPESDFLCVDSSTPSDLAAPVQGRGAA